MLTYRLFSRLLVLGLLASVAGHALAHDSVALKHGYATVNGVRLHYVTAGEGKLILFLHGFPEFWYQWKPQLDELSRDHRVVALDMRGYNESTRPQKVEDYAAPKLLEDVRQLLNHLGANRCIMVGHDWGGLLAWTFASIYPERVEKLIILNAPHPNIMAREFKENPAQIHASQYMYLFNTEEAEAALMGDGNKLLVYHVLSDGLAKGYVSQSDRQRYEAIWGDGGSVTAGLNYYRASRLRPALSDGEEWIPGKHYVPGVFEYPVRVPTLVLWGLQDPYLLGGHLSNLKEYVPNMVTKFYADVGHWLNRARARDVNQDIRSFLEREEPK